MCDLVMEKPELAGRSRMSVMQIAREEKVDELKEKASLSPWATAFSLFKGFVGTGILYMPQNFINAGWGFSTMTLILAVVLTITCAKLLIETRDKLGGNLSFPEIGQKIYGKWGRIAVEMAIIGS